MKAQATKIETFRSHLLDRIQEGRVTSITYDSAGNRYFQTNPKPAEYTWVFDLADREGLRAHTEAYSMSITITEEKTNE